MSLQINGLNLSIAEKIICQSLTMTFKPGQFWGIMGLNGAGKTTLLHSLIGLNADNKAIHSNADEGRIQLNNKNIHHYSRLELARNMGMMHQEYEYLFPSTVLEAALIGRHPYIKPWQWQSEQDCQLAIQSLSKLGLETFQDRSVSSLSGGEKRRLNLATLLTQNPQYLLLDEPINHLDIKAQMDILQLLQTLVKEQNKCAIMVIHEPNLAYRFCDQMLLLFEQGQWLSGSSQTIMSKENLSRLYACAIQQIDSAEYRQFIPI